MEYVLFAVALVVLLNSLGTAALLLQSKKPNKGVRGQVVVDTSGLIDGRILDVAAQGFIPSRIIVPHIVVGELQHLADLADPYKRERARFGLDVIKQLQAMPELTVVIVNEETDGILVDDQLVKIAGDYGASLYTTDYNLNKVAAIKGLRVLNVNELAQGLRGQVLPGEKALIKIVQKGQDKTQGVGYLPEGTMVVVEKASSKIDQVVEVTFIRVLQTQAGKMFFARLSHPDQPQQPKKPAIVPVSKQPKTAQSKPAKQQDAPKPQKPARKPAEDVVQPIASQPAAKPEQQQTAGRPNPRRRRRRTPEDSLMATVKELEQ